MIHSHTKEFFERYAKPGLKIVELGDQVMDCGIETQFKRTFEVYPELDITSIDWHGRNNVLKLDLSTVLNERFGADLLTDLGTVEHVSDLYNALLNCHNFTKVGGIMIHANPKTGTYDGHGVSFFTMDFWRNFAKEVGYELLTTYERHPYSDENTDVEVFAALKKKKEQFITKEEFNTIEGVFRS